MVPRLLHAAMLQTGEIGSQGIAMLIEAAGGSADTSSGPLGSQLSSEAKPLPCQS